MPAVTLSNASASSVTYKLPRAASQMRHVEGAPMGTRGGIVTLHNFPADGLYQFRLNVGGGLGTRFEGAFPL